MTDFVYFSCKYQHVSFNLFCTLGIFKIILYNFFFNLLMYAQNPIYFNIQSAIHYTHTSQVAIRISIWVRGIGKYK